MGNPIISKENQKFHICAKVTDALITIGISNITGLEDDIDDNIRIFPNPASDELVISIRGPKSPDHLSAVIYNLNGKVVKYRNLAFRNQKKNAVLSIKDLPPGMYIISLEGEYFNIKQRFMKY